jgi:hypothetical protein
VLQALPVTPTDADADTGVPAFSVQLMLPVFAAGLVEVNGLAAAAVTVTVPPVAAATLPMLQLTVPSVLTQPPVQLTKLKPAGSGSVIVTPVPLAVP